MRLGPKRYISMTPARRKRVSGGISVFFVCAGVLCMAVYVLTVLRPAFSRLAENSARRILIQAINETVEEEFSDTLSFDDVVKLTYTENNKISGVTSNLTGVSRVKSILNLSIQQKISDMDRTRMNIPLGSLTGSDLFAGSGPDIPFWIKPYGTVVTDISTDFQEAGINQTRCDISVNVRAQMSVFGFAMGKVSTVETNVPILQTVIVGDVPQSFTHVDRDGYAFEDDVLQLAE